MIDPTYNNPQMNRPDIGYITLFILIDCNWNQNKLNDKLCGSDKLNDELYPSFNLF